MAVKISDVEFYIYNRVAKKFILSYKEDKKW